MKILIDTSAYSAFMRGHHRAKSILQQADEIVLSPIVIGELLSGFAGGRKLSRNRNELEAFLASPRVSVNPIDVETAERYAVILNSLREAGTPIPTNDIWIAAHAMQYGLCVVTADADFQKIRQILIEFLTL